jgi:8-amino-7-oxononanoate synthase
VPVRTFRSHDVAALQVSLATAPRAGRTPWVVADGLDPLRGRPVPLPDYLDLVRRHGGSVILDDTQALGILGRCPNPANPYGAGGAGVPAWFGLSDPRIIRVASLAKGFGAPLALIGGQRQFVERFKTVSKTRVHCSPPSRAALAAAWQALTINARRGDALRSQLLHRVRLLRKGLRAIGLAVEGGCFPIQTLIPPARMPAAELHSALQSLGVASVRHRAHQGGAALVSFLLSASHTQTDIATALGALRWIAASRSRNEIKNPALLIQE